MTPELITIARARELVAAACPRLGSEDVAVAAALGRVLAEDVSAAAPVPPFANSAMDGFAVKAGAAGRRLEIVDESRAGAPAGRAVADGEAIRISTGAPLPHGAEAVVQLEHARVEDGAVELEVEACAGDNLRNAGDDMRAGERVLATGTVLGAAELGVAVAAGRGSLTCARRPRVAVVATGDELRAPGEALGPGQIHNSNAVTLTALATQAGAVTELVTTAADTLDATIASLDAAISDSDVLVVSGGVSVGAHDHTKPALEALGVEQRFWGVALKPGKPTWFGVRSRAGAERGDAQLAFGLPGNPVSAMVTFLLFVRPALAAMQGASPLALQRSAAVGVDVARDRGRDEAVRVRLEEEAGALRAYPTGLQSSHLLTSMLGADALMVVERGEDMVAAGTAVTVELI